MPPADDDTRHVPHGDDPAADALVAAIDALLVEHADAVAPREFNDNDMPPIPGYVATSFVLVMELQSADGCPHLTTISSKGMSEVGQNGLLWTALHDL